MRYGGVFVIQVLDLLRVRQIADTENAVHGEFAHIDVNVIGNVGGKALDFDFAENLIENAALGLDANRHAQQLDADTDAQGLVERDALHVDVDQLVLDGLALPVDDHGLGRGRAGDLDIEDGVVAGLGEENPRDLLGIDFDGDRIVACTIKDGRNFSGDTHAARGILVELALTGLGYDHFRHSNLSFLYSGTGLVRCRSLCWASSQFLVRSSEDHSNRSVNCVFISVVACCELGTTNYELS